MVKMIYAPIKAKLIAKAVYTTEVNFVVDAFALYEP